MAFLIDGNNFLGYAAEIGFFPGGRGQLLSWLQKLGFISKSRILLVFDGPPDPSLAQFDYIHEKSVRIYYPPPGETADDVLKEKIDRHPDPRSLTVVSSDREIRDHAKSRGAKTRNCPQFFKELKAASRQFNELRSEEKEEVNLSPLDLDLWMDVFSIKENKGK